MLDARMYMIQRLIQWLSPSAQELQRYSAGSRGLAQDIALYGVPYSIGCFCPSVFSAYDTLSCSLSCHPFIVFTLLSLKIIRRLRPTLLLRVDALLSLPPPPSSQRCCRATPPPPSRATSPPRSSPSASGPPRARPRRRRRRRHRRHRLLLRGARGRGVS